MRNVVTHRSADGLAPTERCGAVVPTLGRVRAWLQVIGAAATADPQGPLQKDEWITESRGVPGGVGRQCNC